MLAHNYVMNCDEQGLGKTLQAIAVQQATEANCLVICPATLKYGWKDEFLKFTTLQADQITVGLKLNLINIVNYEHIYKCTELIMKADLVIIDEAHYLIHLESQRSTYIHRMIRKYKPERLIMLTGTPIKNRVTDFYSLLLLASYTPVRNNGRLITEKFKTQESYNDFFCNSYTMNVTVRPKSGSSFKKKIKKYSGIRNVETLKAYMRFKLIRRLAKNVLDLPPLIQKNVVVSYKDDSQLFNAFKQFEEGEEYNVSVKKQAAVSVANFTADYVRDIISSGEGPVIIFSDHVEPLEIIEKKLKKYKSAKITGKVKIEDRQKAINNFQSGKLDLILCTAGAANTGITLTASRNMVLNDIPWDYSMLSQLIKRFHRIGQEASSVVLHKMIGTKVGQKIMDSLMQKAENIKQVLEEEN